jgi:HEAT repeat protein
MSTPSFTSSRGFVALGLCFALGLWGCADEAPTASVDWVEEANQLVQRGVTDPDPWVRAESIRILGLTRDVLLLEHVRAALDDGHPLVQTSALESLIRRGSSAAEDAILTILVRGTFDQKIRLLDLVFEHGTQNLQRNAVRRALRDVDSRLRVAALERMTARSLAVDRAESQRLLADSNEEVVVAAFRNLCVTDPDTATDETLRRMRSDDSATRQQGMRFAVVLGSPDVWASMRSFLRSGTERERAIAALALGTIGDPLVEDSLRQTVLSGAEDDAAEALRALARIPTERAQMQAGRHRRDPRGAVRRAAFDVMRDLNYPSAEFEPHLDDPDPRIGALVLEVLRRRDPQHAASVLSRSLQSGAQPVHVLAALHAKAQRESIDELLRAARPQLEQLSGSADDDASALATRLLLLEGDVRTHVELVRRLGRPSAMLAATEAAIGARDSDYSALFAEALQQDLFFLRLAGGVGVLTLGDAWVPPTVATDVP